MTSRPPRSDHFDGERFFNPGVDSDKSFGELLRWSLNGKRATWPKRVANGPLHIENRPVAAGEIAVIYIGHATLLVQVAGCTMLTDPIFSERASPVGWAGAAAGAGAGAAAGAAAAHRRRPHQPQPLR